MFDKVNLSTNSQMRKIKIEECIRGSIKRIPHGYVGEKNSNDQRIVRFNSGRDDRIILASLIIRIRSFSVSSRSRVPKSRTAPSFATSRTFYSRSVEFFVTATPRSIFAQPGLGTTSLDLPRPYANAATYATAAHACSTRGHSGVRSLAYVAHDLLRSPDIR